MSARSKATFVCSSEGCNSIATEVLVLRDQPGHVHDCPQHAAVVREWCDVTASYPMPCPLPCTTAPVYTSMPAPLDDEADR